MKRLTSSAIPAQSILGMTSQKKECLLSGIAQISSPTPSPQFGQLGPLFSGRQKQRFAHMTEKSTDDDDDGQNDNLF